MEKALHKLRVKFTVDLHPAKLSAVQKGVQDHLRALLLRYNDDFDGVILAVDNERILTQRAHVHPYFPLVRVDVEADVLLFKPRVGMRLEGMVNKVGVDYIGLLVLDFMNAVVGAAQIRPDIRHSFAHSRWASQSNPKHLIEVGTHVFFTVHEIKRTGEFISLGGALLRSDTGAAGFAAAPAKQPAGAKPEKKKKRKKDKQAAAAEAQQQPSSNKKPRLPDKQPAAAAAAAGGVPLANGIAPTSAAAAGQRPGKQPAEQQQQTLGKAKKAAKKAKSGEQQQRQGEANGNLAKPEAKLEGKPEAKPKKRKHKAAAEAAEAAAAVAAAPAPAAAAEEPKKKKKKKHRES